MVTIASRPADADHPYGHHKAEYFSSGFEGLAIMVAATGIALGVGYLGWSLAAKVAVEREADRALARMGLADAPRFSVPMPLNTLLWRVVAMTPGGYVEGFRSLAADRGAMRFVGHPSNVQALREAGEVPTVQRLVWFTHGFVQARVAVAGETVGRIGQGLLVLVCAERGDSEAQADKLLAKLLKLRIFSDAAGKMNRSVQDLDGQGACGGLLVVSQFTLAADASGGNRPSFTSAAPPDVGRRLYDYVVARARKLHPLVETGRFAADMQVHLVNDGPVTIALHIAPDA
jgi:D-tyrosyl-tRNA(Tyr) deacylase